jgi:hypothetical protein
MSRNRRRRHGEGTAWLVADRAHDDDLCYWYAGTNDGYLVEQARAARSGQERQEAPACPTSRTDC